MFTYVRWYWLEDDCWNYEELDADRWPVRHVEVRRSDSALIAAASLVEVLAARDSDGLDAVRRYEQRYGTLPEGPFPSQNTPTDPVLEPVEAADFEQLWRDARQHLESGQ
jgi:hypothetical protein